MLKFNTSCAVLAYLSSNLLNDVGLSLFRYFEVGLRLCDIVVKKFTFAISSPDEFLFFNANRFSGLGGVVTHTYIHIHTYTRNLANAALSIRVTLNTFDKI